jgi:hypothetical protein
MSPRFKFVVVLLASVFSVTIKAVGGPWVIWAPLAAVSGWYVSDVWRALREPR